MSAANSSQSTGSTRRSSKGKVRDIEYSRKAVTATSPAAPSYARYVGRVGALALALGVGSAFAAMPIAFADTTGSAGSSGSESSASSSAPAKSSATRSGSRGS